MDYITAIQHATQAARGSLRSLETLLRGVIEGTVPLFGNGMTVQATTATANATITPGVHRVELNHATVVIAATIAAAKKHAGLFVVANTSASGTAAHTLTLTDGTFDGTNNVATLNAPGEQLIVMFDKNGDGTILANIGGVALS